MKQILERARWLIDCVGWAQGAYGFDDLGVALTMEQVSMSKGSCFCTLGAAIAAEKELHTRGLGAGLLEVERLIGVALGLGDRNVAEWNDEPHRTKEEVLARFDMAIGGLQ